MSIHRFGPSLFERLEPFVPVNPAPSEYRKAGEPGPFRVVPPLQQVPNDDPAFPGRTWEMGFVERQVADEFEGWLDMGLGIADAIDKICEAYEGLDPEFLDFLT